MGSDGAGGTSWQLGTPSVVGPASAASPVNCFGTNLAGNYNLEADIWLRSPTIDLSAAGGATLRYNQFRDIEDGFDFGFIRVLRASDNAQLGPDIASEISGTSGDWETFRANLPAEALGEVIKIEFQLVSDDVENFRGWYIDNVEIVHQ